MKLKKNGKIKSLFPEKEPDKIPKENDYLITNDESTCKETLECKTKSSTCFQSLQNIVSKETMEAIEKLGFEHMTEIQSKAIPQLLDGNDLRGTAKTGSGKTLAFLIPAVELMKIKRFKPKKGIGAIIISPTRELAMQTHEVLLALIENQKISCGLIMGGSNRKKEIEELTKGVNIIVATPGRLLDHLNSSENFKLKRFCCLVIDEADKILDVGFEEEMKKIIKLLPKERQTMLFSATKDSKTNELARLTLKEDSIEVDVDMDKIEATVDGLEQEYLVTPSDKKFLVLYTLLKKSLKKKQKVMVFFSSCKAVKFYYELLNLVSIPVKHIHGQQKQFLRSTTFSEFNSAESGILLCTDVAARGWDIPAVDGILQYDPPNDPREYIHRVGRTARAGSYGCALLFLNEEEMEFVRYLKINKVNIDYRDINWDKICQVQSKLEDLLSQNRYLRESATEAFKSFLRAYNSHSLKEVFDIKKLNLFKVAKGFGFSKPPVDDLQDISMTKRKIPIDYGPTNKNQEKTKKFRRF